MKKIVSIISLVISFIITFTSCESFLEEEPKTFLSPDFYFNSDKQVDAAVNGIYTFLDDRFNGDIEVGSQTYLFFEYLPGYADRPYSSSSTSINQAVTLNVKEDNLYLDKIWETNYKAIENCNSIIEGIEKVTPAIMNEDAKNIRWGEVYFMRAYSYFNLVRLFGEVPLKISSTKSLSGTQIELSSIASVYAQIEKDLRAADSLMVNNAWATVEGRIAKGAVKTLLTQVYITMAGYPLQKGKEYYQKAYDEAKSIVASTKFYFFGSYAAMRDAANENSGEYILMIQREKQYAGSPVHFNMLPYPEPTRPISSIGQNGGALAPSRAFYDSYTAGDKRVEEKGFYYTKHEAFDDPSVIVELNRPYIYKFWDDAAAKTGQSGKNYPLLTYADVLLMLAEAKTQVDG
ncbi:MAG TPA: RagB/SusD family nutrient uptake outer membrane protein, partial [Bacteroidales bacterium]|nr:RagB/SusD family nutrient uptake outer membrane protein [Bacteroidales bacterium]